MEPSLARKLLLRDGRVRPGWRLGLFFLLFVLLAVAGHVAISPLPRSPLQWGSITVLTLSALVAGWTMLWRMEDVPAGALGFPLRRYAARETLLGFAAGAILITAVLAALALPGTAAFVADAGTFGDYLLFLLWTLLFFTVAATFEEALFRGYPFQVLVEWIGTWPATVLASALFSAAHAQNPNVTAFGLLNIFLAGVMLSVAYLRTLSLWFATALHVAWNWLMASLYDLPVSGLEFDTPLYTARVAGNDWWTGGAFGPEAGLVGTLALLAGTLWLTRSGAVRPHPETLRLRPVVLRRLPASPTL